MQYIGHLGYFIFKNSVCFTGYASAIDPETSGETVLTISVGGDVKHVVIILSFLIIHTCVQIYMLSTNFLKKLPVKYYEKFSRF
jgi:hypothetical protein